jgi:hypothetical protein
MSRQIGVRKLISNTLYDLDFIDAQNSHNGKKRIVVVTKHNTRRNGLRTHHIGQYLNN